MPAPELNLGNAPNDSDDIQDLWYALEELGFAVGVIGQSDYDFINSGTVPADGDLHLQVRAPGGDQINGQIVSTGQYSCDVEWLSEEENVVRREGVLSNREGDVWANFSIDPKSPFADIVIVNDTNAEQTVNATAHYR